MRRAIYLMMILAGCGGTVAPGPSAGNADQAGGALTIGGMNIDIPAGALTRPVAFILTSVEQAGSVASLSYRVDGDVSSFANPARVTFSVPMDVGFPV